MPPSSNPSSSAASAPSPAHAAALELLLHLTGLPTAAGREHRIIAAIERWAAGKPLAIDRDAHGNMVVRSAHQPLSPAPDQPVLYITGHLDHPGFVVESIESAAPCRIILSFRGGVMADFFTAAPVTLYTAADQPVTGTLESLIPGPSAERPFGEHYRFIPADADAQLALELAPGDVGRFTMPGPELDAATGTVHTPACDDLAAVAAALAAFDGMLAAHAGSAGPHPDTRLLLTRAEEIGFIGAIGACKSGLMPRHAVVLALENSRAFAESPVHGGPIVRVGDRLSIFTPWLTAACAARAEALFGGASAPTAQQTSQQAAKRPWQRKLMAGGACEATVFCAAGYNATCLCLPLGNYHNMPHLAELQAGTYDRVGLGPPRAAREFIAAADYLGLVDLLVELSLRHPEQSRRGEPAASQAMIDRLWAKSAAVLQG